MRLILARHGETDWNKQGRILGISDLELNETGRWQAAKIAEALKNEAVEAIYSSPLKRARDTADTIAHFHDVDVVTLSGLRELDAGEVDGLTYEEMSRYYGDFLEKWIEDCTSVRPPGGCSLPELQDQVWQAIQFIVDKHKRPSPESGMSEKGIVVAVAHFFPILSIICRVLGLDLSACRRLKLNLASITTLDFNASTTVLTSWNNTCHLREMEQ